MKKAWLVLIAAVMTTLCLGLPAGVAGSEPVQSTPVGTFPEWVNFYGINSTFNGAPMPVGSEVVAYTGSTRCGSFVVHTAGQYGLMPCYRNQTDQPGAQPGDTIHFTVNGYEAILRGPDDAVWTTNGDRKNVELEAQGVPQTPTGTATQTTMPTSTPGAGTSPATAAPTSTPVATAWVPPSATPTFWSQPSITPTFWVPPTLAPTPMPMATSAQVGYCRNAIVDGDFESGTGWSIDAAPRVASRSTAQTHTGSYAMRMGIVDESNVSSPSAIRQRIDIPADATYALLSFYYYPVAETDRRSDYWEVMLFEPGTNNTIATLWKNNTGNERRWLLMNIDLLAYRGRSLDLYFNVYNDGQGGASALYVDDVVFQICTPTSVTATPTHIIVTAVPTPVTPYPTPSGACQELIVNGGFESGAEGWFLGPTERMAGVVSEPRHSGNQAMRLGFIDGLNVHTFSSIRQTVSVPADAISAAITFWTYPMSTANSGQDHQEFVILSPADNSTLGLPWRVYYDNSRAWTQQRIDLMAYRGQSIVVYFNAFNDGYGGNTALIVDDISLLACRQVIPTAMPLGMGTLAPTATFGQPTTVGVTSPEGGSAGAADSQTNASTTPTQIVFARATPTMTPVAAKSTPNPVLVAGIAIAAAIAITAIVFLVARGGSTPPRMFTDSGGDTPPTMETGRDAGGGASSSPSSGASGAPREEPPRPTRPASTERQTPPKNVPFVDWYADPAPARPAPDPWSDEALDLDEFDDDDDLDETPIERSAPAPSVPRPTPPASSTRDRVVSSVTASNRYRRPAAPEIGDAPPVVEPQPPAGEDDLDAPERAEDDEDIFSSPPPWDDFEDDLPDLDEDDPLD
jgi:hypothetical protein